MPADKPIRWGILSTANIAANAFIPAARRTQGAELVAVASRDPQKAADFAGAHQIPLALEGYQALLDNDTVDAVYNPLPNSLHAEWTLKAAAAGKHVFCEKPLATTAADAAAMVDACRDAGVLLFEAFVFLHHPQSKRLLDLVRGGSIGKLRHIDAAMTFKIDDPSNIHLVKSLGGGSIYDGGVYPIAFSRFIAGADPLSVQAVVRFDPKSGVDVWSSLLLEYPDGVTSTLYSGFEGGGGPHALLTGDQGKLVVPSPYHPPGRSRIDLVSNRPPAAGNPASQLVQKCVAVLRGPTLTQTERINTGSPPFQPAIHFFQECVRQRQAPTYMADHAVGTLKVVEAAFQSAKTGQRITL